MTNEEVTQRSFKDKIKSWRIDKDLGLHQVARMARVNRIYLELIEKGEAVPTEDVVKKLAKVLGKDEEALELWQSEQPKAPELPTEPNISPEAEEDKFFWS
jgi:transcriptional regulator with XRE-family HTH domain